MPPSTALVWLRRDLRLHDHPALRHAVDGFGRVVPVFVVDDAIVGGRWPSPNRWWFLARALGTLRAEVEARSGRLVIVRGDPLEWIPRLARELGASSVVVSRDYSPFGRARDADVAAALAADGVEWQAGRGLLVHEPEDVSRDGGAFHVFSPFHRRWLERPVRARLDVPRRIPSGELPATLQGDPVELLGDPVPTADPDLLLEPSERAARRRLAAWAGSVGLRDYDTGRDRLDLDGTSRLSQDLRWGLLSPVDVLTSCGGDGRGPARFRSELAWRDFYAHLLWHEPALARRSFRPGLDGVWAAAPEPAIVDAWTWGRTGFPVVDAAMRQLQATGWMHNRARMIVASFLTKHLLVDWRIGEAHFMRHLVDGDPASNNGGWQWAASTGTDPQPYFRIFNPTLQGQRHDPAGEYVRRWVPELRGVPGADVHAPPAGEYLAPIVDHRTARRAALEAYERARAAGGSPADGAE